MNRRNFFDITTKALIALSANPFTDGISKFDFGPKVKFRFAIASDGHFGQAETPYVENHYKVVQWMAREKENSELDFVLFNGDLVHDEVSLFPDLRKILDTLPMKYFVSRGNHDKCDPATWQAHWNTTLNFSFEEGNMAFIILDTSNEKGKYLCPDIEWTKNELNRYKSKEHIFVFMHITPIPWTQHSINCKELVEVFSKQANLKAVFHGHDHDHDNVKFYGGKPYFFDGHFGGNWGTNYHGYRIVEITNDRIITYQVNPEASINTNSVELRSDF